MKDCEMISWFIRRDRTVYGTIQTLLPFIKHNKTFKLELSILKKLFICFFFKESLILTKFLSQN